MGRDKIRYLEFLNGRWRWHPSKAMREAGFRLVTLSEGTDVDGVRVPGIEDKKSALRLNEDWDRHRLGLPALAVEQRRYPKGSIGDAYLRVMALRETERRNKGIVWAREQHSRDDWPRAWKWIGPVFGDCDPNTVSPEDLIGDTRKGVVGLRPLVASKVSESEAHRVIKVWRALWKKMATFGYCDKARDPALVFANSAPPPRQALWREGEAVRLIKTAWRNGYHGLAALLAVAWDSMLVPVDARRLMPKQMRRDGKGVWFEVGRAKSGKQALATLSRRSERLLMAYLRRTSAEPLEASPIFRSRKGLRYTKDMLSEDFRDIRTMVFGDGETRWLVDFRRSGSTEALAGAAPAEKLSNAMANTLSTSNRLHATYGPTRLASVRDVNEHRLEGRTRLREQTSNEIPTTPAKDSNNADQQKAKSLK